MHQLFQVHPKTLFPALTAMLQTNCREIKEWLERTTLCDTVLYADACLAVHQGHFWQGYLLSFCRCAS